MTTQHFPYVYERLYPWRAFFVALVLYLFLSFRELSAWTRPVWLLLAFGLVPLISAFAGGRGGLTGDRVRASLWSVGMAMALYTGFHLIRLHRGIGSTGDVGTGFNVFLVGLLVSIVYGLGAAAVSAVAGEIWSRIGARETEK